MTTLNDSKTSYRGASGQSYVIFHNTPFPVIDPIDIEYFDKKPQFMRVNILTKLPPNPDDIDVKLEKDIFNLDKKISNKDAQNVRNIYDNENALRKSILDGDDLDDSIPKWIKKKIIRWINKKLG